jgi:hypothetical protein
MKRSPQAFAIAASIVVAAVFGGPALSAVSDPAANPCDGAATSGIPSRPSTAPTGSEFVHDVEGLSNDEREAAIYRELTVGDVPGFLRKLVPVRLSAAAADGRPLTAVICVAPDYLAVGSNRDYLLVPMRLDTALAVAGRFGFVLPTRHMVDAIYRASTVHLAPQPLPAGDAMRSTAYYERHNALVQAQRAAAGAPLGALTAGDKKDIVITKRLWNNLARVAIYGWHRMSGRPIQPLSTVHGWHYADYSHGVRLVSAVAYVDGQPRSIVSLLADPRTAALFSDEGSMPRLPALLALLRTPWTLPLQTIGFAG